MTRAALLLLLASGAAVLSATPEAQGPGPGVTVRFDRLGAADGLSQSSVLALAQDRRGFVWLGTQDGLNRYDGVRMRTYRHDPTVEGGLPASYVQSLAVTRDGAVWAGTWGGGLARLDPETDRFTVYRHDPDDPASLPDDIVTTLHEDAAGRLWVGTAGGLAWFDPEPPADAPHAAFGAAPGAFRRYAEAVMADPFVWSLASDARGRLWIGTFRAGALRVDPASGLWRRFHHDPADPASLGADDNALVRVTPSGEVWVGTGAGLNRLVSEGEASSAARSGATGAAATGAAATGPPGASGDATGAVWERHSAATGLCGDYVYDLRETRDGATWVATGDGGLCRQTPAAPRTASGARGQREGAEAGGAAGARPSAWEAFTHNPADPASLPKDVVRALLEDRAGTVWIGTDGGGAARYTGASEALGLYTPDPLDAASLPYPYVWALHATRDGSVWAGTDGGGLARLDPATGTFQTLTHRPGDPASLGADVILSLEESRDGRLWIGTFDAGLDRLDPATGRIEHFPASPPPEASAPEAGAPEATRGVPATGPPVSTVTALYEDAAGALWVGTWDGGLARRSPDGAWTVWRHDPDDPATLAGNVVTALRPARDGGLWIGTYGGGLAHRGADGAFRAWNGGADGPLASATVYGVHEDEAGAVWIATAGGGLNKLDPGTGAVEVLTTRDGLPHNIVYGVLPGPGGALWLSTNAGIARLDPATGGVRTYGPAQGAQGPEFNSGAAYAAADGSLMLGGTNGFNWFRPEALDAAAPPPRVVLTGLRRFDEPVPLARSVSALGAVALSHRDNFVTVEFAAPGARDARGLEYAYRLEGVDPDWREATGESPEARYTDLPPGRYAFRVRAREGGGAWGEERALAVRVVPPWWATWWARGLGALGLAGGGLAAAGLWRRRRTAERERQREESAEAQRRLAAGREAERLRLARDLHDGPLQDLYGARFRLESLGDALGGDAQPDVARAQSTAEAVEETLLDVSRQLRAVCTELRPPVLGAMGVARALRADADRLGAEHPGIAFDLDLRADGLALGDAARVAVYRIAKEALANAVRHAAPSRVRIATREERAAPEAPAQASGAPPGGDGAAAPAARFTVTVEDDGRGFAVPPRWAALAREGHLGLAGAAERAEGAGGALAVRSAPGAGTTVTVSVPLASPQAAPLQIAPPEASGAQVPTP